MSASHEYRGRRAAVVDNDALRVTALEEGGHIAEIFDKRSGAVGTDSSRILLQPRVPDAPPVLLPALCHGHPQS
jgi:hypothetical protein